jgi:hypothetical protein
MPFSVTSVNPACGSVLVFRPKVFVVTFSDPPSAATVASSDFKVNGVSAATVSYTAGQSVATFTYTTDPVTFIGTYTMSIAAGAILRSSDNLAIDAFSCTFDFTPGIALNLIPLTWVDGTGTVVVIPNAGLYPRRWIPQPFIAGSLINPQIWGTFNFGPAYIGYYYREQWYLENVSQPVVFTLESGTLPPGLLLSDIGDEAEGQIEGIPTALGLYTFSLRATASDEAGGVGTFDIREFTIEVTTKSAPVGSSIVSSSRIVGGGGTVSPASSVVGGGSVSAVSTTGTAYVGGN